MTEICNAFQIKFAPKSVNPYGMGHINRTYLVECNDGTKYILQKINHAILGSFFQNGGS